MIWTRLFERLEGKSEIRSWKIRSEFYREHWWKIFIGYLDRAERGRWLEYAKAPALRTRLAGLSMFANAFCDRED